MSPSEFGEALREALAAGHHPNSVNSGWTDVILPLDCSGCRPEGDLEEVRDQTHFILISCGLDEDEVDRIFAWYESIPEQRK